MPNPGIYLSGVTHNTIMRLDVINILSRYTEIAPASKIIRIMGDFVIKWVYGADDGKVFYNAWDMRNFEQFYAAATRCRIINVKLRDNYTRRPCLIFTLLLPSFNCLINSLLIALLYLRSVLVTPFC